MNTEKKLVPSLRFPTFIQDGEWKKQKFSSLFVFLPNNTLSRADLTEWKGDVYNVHYGDVLIKLDAYTDIQQGKLPAIKTINNIDKYLKARLQDGDIVIADTAEDETVGKCTEIVNVHDTIVVSGLHTIPCRPQIKFAQAYLGYYMNSNAFHSKLLPIMQGVKVTSISKSALQNIDLAFPESLEEQQKIAECLSSIDSYISSINEKVEQLKAHKKSLMQKLFPQRGQTVPEYRFPEFEKDGSWEELELGELIVEIVEFTSRGDKFPLYSLTIEDGVSPKTDRYERNFLVKKKGDNFKVVYPYDFVSNPMNLRFGAIGYNKESFKVCISGYYDVFRFKDKGTSSFWISYMKSYWALDMYDRIATGSLYEKRRVHFSSLLRTKLLVPKYSERLKISEYLSSMEEVISLNSKKASLLEQHKKGIMQQLFHKS